MKIKYFFFLLTSFMLFACSKDKVAATAISDLDLTAVSYSKNVQPIIEANCIQCHSVASELELYDYDHVAMFAASGQLSGCLTGNVSFLPMPIGSTLDSIQIKTFINWIEQGFQDN